MDYTPLQQKIINASIKEFSQYGYRLASTNRIAEEAGVSKGAIFKNFHSKSNLFWLVYQQALDAFLVAYQTYPFTKDKSFLEKISEMITMKMHYRHQQPMQSAILWEGVTNPPEEIKEKLYASLTVLRDVSIESLLDHVELAQLNPSFSKEKVQRFLSIAIAGLQAVYVTPTLTLEALQAAQEESLTLLQILWKGMEK